MNLAPDKGPRQQQGVALIIVMIVIMVLSVLAAGFAFTMRVETRLARQSINKHELEWLGRSGVELAKYVLIQQARIPGESGFLALNQKWAGGPGTTTNSPLDEISLSDNVLGGGRFSVKIIDLERKINVNLANRIIIERALLSIGVDAGQIDGIIDAHSDWLDSDELHKPNGAESDYYTTLDPPYYSKNAYIDHLSELLLIKGITPEIYWGPAALDHVRNGQRSVDAETATEQQVYSVGLVDIFTTISNGRININTAPLNVLRVLPDVDEAMAAGIIQFRSGPDGIEGNEDDTNFKSVGQLLNVPGMTQQILIQLQRYCSVVSQSFQVQVDAQIGDDQRTFFATIVRMPNQPTFTTLNFYWE
jgi:general secretion pathway protein K